MVWINPSNTEAVNVSVIDPIPENTTYVAGSVVCEVRGESTITRCEFDAPNNRIIYEGSIAPDPGAINESEAAHEVLIVFLTTVGNQVNFAQNQGVANWDADGNGFVDDNVLAGQSPVVTDDPTTARGGDPTTWRRGLTIPGGGPTAIPTLSSWGLVLMGLLLVMLLNGPLRRRSNGRRS